MPARDDPPAAATGSSATAGGGTAESFLTARLRALPQPALAGVVLACVLVGLVIAGIVGGLLLGAAIGLLVMVLAVGWSVMTQPERLLRIAILVLLVAVSVVRVVSR